jgi:nucleoside-diphosphate kinase
MQRSLVLLKPDAVQRGLVGEVIGRLERRGLKIVAMKLMTISEELANSHYDAHVGKPFFEGLVSFITSGPVVAMVLEGDDAVSLVRATMGATDPRDAGPGTVRGDLSISIGRNLIHGSDSEQAAAKEVALFFSADEVAGYARDTDRWITES